MKRDRAAQPDLEIVGMGTEDEQVDRIHQMLIVPAASSYFCFKRATISRAESFARPAFTPGSVNRSPELWTISLPEDREAAACRSPARRSPGVKGPRRESGLVV